MNAIRLGRAFSALLLALAVRTASAQAALSPTDDEFFGPGDALVTEAPEAGAADSGDDGLPALERVRWGGFFTLEAAGTLDAEALAEGEWAGAPGAELDVSGTFFLDARPSEEVRVFAKARAAYPFEEAGDWALRELFADLTLDPGLYLRAGKQTVNWGVGRYWSPANVINLERIDPENPEEELAGPVAARLHGVRGTSNLYAYALLQDMEADGTVGVAAKAEGVVMGTELSLAGAWRPDRPWAAALTATGPALGADLYAEAVLRGGGMGTYVVEDAGAPLGVSVETREAQPAFQGTLGFSWTWSDETETWNLAASAQYLWNGAGYPDPDIFTTHAAGVAALVGSGQIGPEDLYLRGQSYAAASLALSDIARSDAGVSLLWLGNLDDRSGKVTAAASYSGFKNLRIAVSYGERYGKTGSEYGFPGPRRTLGLSVETKGLSF